MARTKQTGRKEDGKVPRKTASKSKKEQEKPKKLDSDFLKSVLEKTVSSLMPQLEALIKEAVMEKLEEELFGMKVSKKAKTSTKSKAGKKEKVIAEKSYKMEDVHRVLNTTAAKKLTTGAYYDISTGRAHARTAVYAELSFYSIKVKGEKEAYKICGYTDSDHLKNCLAYYEKHEGNATLVDGEIPKRGGRQTNATKKATKSSDTNSSDSEKEKKGKNKANKLTKKGDDKKEEKVVKKNKKGDAESDSDTEEDVKETKKDAKDTKKEDAKETKKDVKETKKDAKDTKKEDAKDTKKETGKLPKKMGLPSQTEVSFDKEKQCYVDKNGYVYTKATGSVIGKWSENKKRTVELTSEDKKFLDKKRLEYIVAKNMSELDALNEESVKFDDHEDMTINIEQEGEEEEEDKKDEEEEDKKDKEEEDKEEEEEDKEEEEEDKKEEEEDKKDEEESKDKKEEIKKAEELADTTSDSFAYLLNVEDQTFEGNSVAVEDKEAEETNKTENKDPSSKTKTSKKVESDEEHESDEDENSEDEFEKAEKEEKELNATKLTKQELDMAIKLLTLTGPKQIMAKTLKTNLATVDKLLAYNKSHAKEMSDRQIAKKMEEKNKVMEEKKAQTKTTVKTTEKKPTKVAPPQKKKLNF